MSTFKAEMRSRARSASWPEVVLLAVLTALVLLAWWVLWIWGHSPQGHMLMHGSAHAAAMAAASPLQFALIFVGAWTLMTIAMMLPTTLPLLVLFERMVRGRPTASWLLAVTIFGYLAVWVMVGAGLQVLAWLLQAGADRIVWHRAAPWIAAAAILSIAGLYQFSSLKYACLEKCRSPLSFLTSRWQGGNESLQALHLGAAHGLFCVGCCWSLMLLMFVMGAGSLGAMLVLGIVMVLEKNFAWGRRLSAPLGFLMLAGAAGTLLVGLMQI
jgi:predicted metal-binding membrane protein